MSLNHPVLLI